MTTENTYQAIAFTATVALAKYFPKFTIFWRKDSKTMPENIRLVKETYTTNETELVESIVRASIKEWTAAVSPLQSENKEITAVFDQDTKAYRKEFSGNQETKEHIRMCFMVCGELSLSMQDERLNWVYRYQRFGEDKEVTDTPMAWQDFNVEDQECLLDHYAELKELVEETAFVNRAFEAAS